ncbi:MAG: hypothetical protein AAF671_07695 [Pseudomonadota bacterium]
MKATNTKKDTLSTDSLSLSNLSLSDLSLSDLSLSGFYQKILAVVFAPVLAVSLSNCTSQPDLESSPVGQCATPRPQVCTMQYAPVCATHSDQHQETHSSACNACADDSVISYLPGTCEEEKAL